MSWVIQSQATDKESIELEESLFFTGNGYIGIRGNFEEGAPDEIQSIRGTYLNGFHDIVPISYGEKLYGFPDTQQKLVNMIDAQEVQIWVGEQDEAEQLSLSTGELLNYERTLYLDKGYSERKLHWRSKHGHELIVTFKRMTSFQTKELFYQHITITPKSKDIPIRIVSNVRGDVQNFVDPTDPRIGSSHAKTLTVQQTEANDTASYIEVNTTASELSAAVLSTVKINQPTATTHMVVYDENVETEIAFTLTEPTIFEKRSLYTDSRHTTDLKQTLLQLQHAMEPLSAETLFSEQETYLTTFWKQTDIQITGNQALQEGIRFNLFHVLQSTGQDGISNIAAKGLSGEGYEGHYFWDTEIYLLPLFTMTNPKLAKQLLLYRYSILDAARNRAKEMGHQKGALFPWRTIAGDECSSYFPAGSAQYHISADIAYSYIQYFLATNDVAFLASNGAEVLIETARLWMEVGHFSKGAFRIDAVTGPDEYTCIVNNNYYTNVMAKHNLSWAVKAVQLIKEHSPAQYQELKQLIQLHNAELEQFQQAADAMYLPVDDTLQINPQDDTFLQKKVWDFAQTPKSNYPLLLHYHPLTLYRYQVCKQADTVLAHLLLEDEQTEEVMKHSYDYYEQVTTHDSSLSTCVFSMMGARLGYMEKSYHYFLETVRLDLDNTQGNTRHGLHMANMGGTWLAIVTGFAGMRVKENGLFFRPNIPKDWESFSFRLSFRDSSIQCTITQEQLAVQLLSGDAVTIHVWNDAYTVTADSMIQVAMQQGEKVNE
ncbi:glycosyl hydrolase family 65 protein [Virgibacillus sp. LDC-1]|uniref:glycoside hydrolase family 65 protein n=1 Tax=Virgibacillus sp. LDC-1 TaxID=3039856 RepID=UPI0024DF04B5|nr:glycosyl hydrolase family 65 protein [Virgibacillus sp. LDC-1]